MNNLSQTELHKLINRYFDAELSVAEEKSLRQYLATGSYKLTAEVEDALAVMSVRSRPAQLSGRKTIATSVKRVAAAAIFAIAFVGVMKYVQLSDEPTYYAYIGGIYTDDPNRVNAIMQSQLNDLSDLMQQSQGVIDNQLEELSEVMLQFDNN